MKVIEEPQLAVKRKLPWLIDIFLYPISVSGIIHLAIFLIAPLLIDLIGRTLLSVAGHYGAALTIVLHILLIGYMLYYIANCVLDSAKGNWRAPDIAIQSTPGAGDLISQIFLILGCVAACFWPTAVYYIFTERTDLIFWLLSVYGIFFLPMSFLAGVMFDSVNALNPILIIGSIFRTLLPYCGLVLLFSCIAAVIAGIVPRLPIWRFISKAIDIYLLFVAAHLLGRFYWWHKDKLDWGV